MNALARFAYDRNDTEEARLEKFAIFLVSGSCVAAGIIWTLMYFAIFGLVFQSALPLVFVIVVSASLLISHTSTNIRYSIYAQIVSIIYVTTAIQWSVGGFLDSGFVLIWTLCGPIVALVFLPIRQAAIWFGLFGVNIVITVVFNDYFSAHGLGVDEQTQSIFVLLNFLVASLVIFGFAGYFVNRAVIERRRAEALLLNTLPKDIIPILKSGRNPIADKYDNASILFCDIVGSTPLFADLPPEEVVDWLNEVYSVCDEVVEKYGLEKIGTIGDSYMVAAGVPVERKDHAHAVASLALEISRRVILLPERRGEAIKFRFGINSGPVVAGVIGVHKFQFDIWGDVVNVASRMEQHSEPGRIHVSANTYELIKNDFEFEARGEIQIKGKGKLSTWFLIGEKAVKN